MKELEHLSEIFNNYDTFIIDLWGVMHNGIKLNPQAIEAINHLKNNAKKIVFLSNAPRPSAKVIDFLLKMKMDKQYLSNVMKKKAIVFMLSDFMDDNYERTLKIVGNKHDITGIRVYDKHDEEIPNLGMVPMIDAETNAVQLINTTSKKVRNNYKITALRLSDYFKTTFKKSGSGTIDTRVDEDYVKKLLGYFKHKGR